MTALARIRSEIARREALGLSLRTKDIALELGLWEPVISRAKLAIREGHATMSAAVTPSNSSRPATDRQREVLSWIRSFLAREGKAPTLLEIQLAFGFASTRAAVDHVCRLEAKGYLTRKPTEHRSIKLTTKGMQFDEVTPEDSAPAPG